MKVILLQDIKNVGRKEQVLEANDGYARNYLFPKKLAIEATKDNMAKLQAKKTSEANKKKAEIDANKEIAKKIEKMELTIKAKVGENSKIFGGITSKEIAEELKKQHNFEIDKKKIVLKETIKNLGRYTAELKFGDGINAKLTVNVTGE
jgi:large subunit ribosomal protein L9